MASSICSSLRSLSRRVAALSKSHLFAASLMSFLSFYTILDNFLGSTPFSSSSSMSTV